MSNNLSLTVFNFYKRTKLLFLLFYCLKYE